MKKSKMTPQEYRKRLMDARDRYFGGIQNATYEQKIQAQIDGESVAEEALDSFISLDYTDDYNDGERPEDFANEKMAEDYRLFIKAFDLPYPTGKPPKEEFELPEY